MKIKGFICICLIFLLVFLIYIKTVDCDIYYLNLSNDETGYSYDTYVYKYLKREKMLEKYVNGFINNQDRVTDLIYAINDNKNVTINGKSQTIKNALIKADLVTLFIGLNDINYKVGYSDINELYDYADSFLNDIDSLLKLVREYCKENIILLGYYNAYGDYYDEYFDYINRKLNKLAIKYDIEFIKTDEFYDINNHIDSIDMNESEHKLISEKIISYIKHNI